MTEFWGPQYDFVTSSAEARLYQTGRGGGKTYAHVWLARKFVKRNPGAVFVSTANSYGQVFEILKQEYDRQFREAGELDRAVRWTGQSSHQMSYKFLGDHGGEIRLRSTTNFNALRGPNIAGFGMDEAAYAPYEAWTILGGCLRQLPGKPTLRIATTTPAGRWWGHWLFTPGPRDVSAPPYLGDDPTCGGCEAFYGSSLDCPYTDDGYKARLLADNPPGTRGHLQEVLGQAVAWEGLVYSCFDLRVHVREMPRDTVVVRRVCGVDWGWQNPGVILCVCMDEHGVLWVTQEIVESYRQPSWWAEEALRLTNEGFGEFYCDPSEPSNIDLMCSRGVNAMKANNEVRPGIGMVSGELGNGRMYVDPSCRHTIREFGLYCYQVTRTGETRPDVIQKGNDHCMDALRYGAMGLQRPASVFMQVL